MSILSHAWEIKADGVNGSVITLDKDLPEPVLSELVAFQTKVGFYSRSLVNSGLDNPGYEHAEISSEMKQ